MRLIKGVESELAAEFSDLLRAGPPPMIFQNRVGNEAGTNQAG